MIFTRRLVVLLMALILTAGIGAAVMPTLSAAPIVSEGIETEAQEAPAAARKRLQFDVAEDGTRFFFDEAPIFDDGLPAYGNSFVTQGYIYEHGTLDGSNGVLPDGSPEFPDKVIGSWTCRGWFIGDGAHTASGPWVITTQLYDLGEKAGDISLMSDGYEIADVNEAVQRAIIGGSGPYRKARGEASQVLLGFNTTEGVNLRFELEVRK